MTQKDRTEVRDMIHGMLSGYQAGITAQNDITNLTLGEIRDHLKILNGTVKEHAEKISDLKIKNDLHITECPAMDKIDHLEKEMVSEKAVKKTLYVGFGIVCTLIASIWALMEILK